MFNTIKNNLYYNIYLFTLNILTEIYSSILQSIINKTLFTLITRIC